MTINGKILFWGMWIIVVLAIIAAWLILNPKHASATSTKGLHAECEINNSDKLCDPSLVCVPFNEQSGNGKCEYPETTPSPSPTHTPTPTCTPKPTASPSPSVSPSPSPSPTPSPTEEPSPTPTPKPNDNSNQIHDDGFGCATHDCSTHPEDRVINNSGIPLQPPSQSPK